MMINHQAAPASFLRESFAKSVLSNKEYRDWVLVQLYKLQTPSEQARQVTLVRNGSGFTAPDGAILSHLAQKVVSGARLNTDEEEILKRRLPKYWRQFTETRLMSPPDRKPPARASTRTITRLKKVAA